MPQVGAVSSWIRVVVVWIHVVGAGSRRGRPGSAAVWIHVVGSRRGRLDPPPCGSPVPARHAAPRLRERDEGGTERRERVGERGRERYRARRRAGVVLRVLEDLVEVAVHGAAARRVGAERRAQVRVRVGQIQVLVVHCCCGKAGGRALGSQGHIHLGT